MAACIAIPLVVALVASRRGPAAHVTPATLVAGWRPECPRSGVWTTFFDSLENSPIPHSGEFALAGPLTDVPEFHDCQRFINDTLPRRLYMSLTAIFARDSLAELTARLDSVPAGGSERKSDSARAAAPPVIGRGAVSRPSAARAISAYGRPIAVAEIMSLDSGYATLGIRQGFTCLYLYGKAGTASGLEARTVPVGLNDSLCLQPLNPSPAVGKVLEVKRTRFTMPVPPVARWDWDATHHRQYMGVACGHAYCEIGAPGFVPSESYITTSPVLAVKGWYDEQRLADPPSSASPVTVPAVGPIVKGTLVPAPDLGKHNGTPDSSDFTNRWVFVATAYISNASPKYEKKLNLERSKVGSEPGNDVSLCYGDKLTCVHENAVASETCSPPSLPGPMKPALQSSSPQSIDPTTPRWWAKIKSAKTHQEVYYCVVQRMHPGVNIPGVVRWRWAIHDETMWVRCLEGCCEVEAGSALET